MSGYSSNEAWNRLALDRPLVFNLLGARRLVMGLFNALAVLGIYRLARQLLGEAIAFLGSVLIAFSPMLLADSRTMRGDALMSSLMTLSVLSFLLFLYKNRRRYLALSGISLGLSILTKITAIPIFGFGSLAIAVYLALNRRSSNLSTQVKPHSASLRGLAWGVGVLAFWTAVTTVTVFVLWPALWVAPLEVYALIQKFAASAIDGRLTYFNGQLYENELLPLFYPVAFLLRATPLVILGLTGITILTGMSFWRLFQQPGTETASPEEWDDLWKMSRLARFTVLALGGYAVIFTVVLTMGALKRDRYLMPIFPAIELVAGAGLWWLVQQARQRWPIQTLPKILAHGRWMWSILTLLILLQLGHIFTTHPFYYTYFNPLFGGGHVAVRFIWAEGGVDTAAAVYLAQQPNAVEQTIATVNIRDFAPAFPGKTVRLVNKSPWITANHIIIRQFHYQTQEIDSNLVSYITRRPPERILEYQGYTWAWIYPGPAAQYYAGSQLDGKAELLGYSLNRTNASPDQPLTIKFFWQNQGYQPPEFIFVRLVDETGFVWAETTVKPLPDFTEQAYIPEVYMEGEAQLPIPVGTPPGLYFLKMGIATPDMLVGEFSLPADGDDILVEKAPMASIPPLTQTFHQPLGQHITLLGAQIDSPLILTPRQTALVTLYWQVDAPIAKNYNLALCLVTDTGEQRGCWQGKPARGRYPWTEWSADELVRDPWLLALSSLQVETEPPHGRYTLKLYLLDPETNNVKGETSIAPLEIMDRLRQYTLPPVDQETHFKLGQKIVLRGYNLTEAPLTGGARFTLTLFWQAAQSIDTDYTVFTQILGPDGRLVGQHDGVPAEGTIPTSSWDIGEIVPDRHILEFPTQQPGTYRLIAGMYNPITGARLPLTDEADHPAGDFITLYTFFIPPQSKDIVDGQ